MVPSIEILSKEMIKPSSPTPQHLKNHNLSLQDQLAPPTYIPLVFFYQPEIKNQNNVDPTQKSQLLKQSLSNTLTKFYPLAGRWINGTLSVDCNDYGIEYVETRVHAQLAQVIEEPSMEELNVYLPKEPVYIENCIEGASIILLAIRVNFFACGGIAIGVCISHKVADGSSLATFMKSWADTCRTRDAADQVVQPVLDFTTQFPPKDLSGIDSNDLNKWTGKEKIVSKRLVFNKEKIETLKKLVASDGLIKNPTRVEAVTTFLWNHFIKVAATTEDDNKKLFVVLHAVNLRPRMNPPLSENSIGNICWPAVALSTPEENKDYHNLGSKLRDSFRSINDDYIKKIQQGGDDFLTSVKKFDELYYNKDVELYTFTSWCRFPLYEVDYGWGKPIWMCNTALAVKNVVILMNTSCGEGIEACVNIVERNVSALENDFKLLSNDIVHGVDI